MREAQLRVRRGKRRAREGARNAIGSDAVHEEGSGERV